MTIKSLGAYYDSDTDLVYSFLDNGTNSYLISTDKDTVNWRFVEGSSTASATAFSSVGDGWFEKYADNIIFTKNEMMSANAISITTNGGLFYIQGSGQLKLYGDTNNPTGESLETHKDRIWVGNISYLSSESQFGKSWVQVSKLYPEAVDTDFALVDSGIVFGEGTAQIIVPGHTYKVGDEVYLSGITFSGVQDDMNQRLFSVVGLEGSGIIIEYNNVNDLTWSTGGDTLLRGATWGTSLLIYDDLLQGAGIFRCDDNNNDGVKQLKSSFGALTIFREQNPYIFTGAIESGSQTLARPLNVPFGALSPFVFLTAGGVWFTSQYGINKVQGTTVVTNQNQLDNIVDITVVEPIKPTFDAITTKGNLVMWGIDTKLLAHDPGADITYAFDTVHAEWFRWTDRLVDRYFSTTENVYAVYKNKIFKLEDGNKVYDYTNQVAMNMRSNYFTKVYTMDDWRNSKVFNTIFSLIQGSSVNSGESNIITVNVFYNGSATPGFSFAWDVKADTISTWDEITTDGTASWNTVTTNGTVTWTSILGDLITMFERRKYRAGTAREIQLEFVHDADASVIISRLLMDYDMLEIDTIQ